MTHQGLRKRKFVKTGEKSNSKAKLVQVSFTSRGLLTFKIDRPTGDRTAGPESTNCDQNNNTGLIQVTNIGFKEIYDHVSVNNLLTCKGRSYPKKLHKLQAPDRKMFLFYRLFVS